MDQFESILPSQDESNVEVTMLVTYRSSRVEHFLSNLDFFDPTETEEAILKEKDFSHTIFFQNIFFDSVNSCF